MLSFGDTADADMAGAFETWRIYVDSQFQGKGIGKMLMVLPGKRRRNKGR